MQYQGSGHAATARAWLGLGLGWGRMMLASCETFNVVLEERVGGVRVFCVLFIVVMFISLLNFKVNRDRY